MTIYIAEVGEYYESYFWQECFLSKAEAYRVAWAFRNQRMNEDRPSSRYSITFDIDYWVKVTEKIVRK